MARTFLIIASLLLVSLTCSAYGELLETTVWAALDPFVGGENGPLTQEDLHRRLLDEARHVLSGMLFGYRFRYVPSDKTRGISEEFELSPIAEIAWGDPALEVVWIQEREHKVWAAVSYRLADYQIARIRAWQSNVMPTATGRGERPLSKGRVEKMGSVGEAIKQAIRQHARGKVLNKPREMAGEVVIWESPQTVVGSGQYITTVRVKLFMQEIRPYAIY